MALPLAHLALLLLLAGSFALPTQAANLGPAGRCAGAAWAFPSEAAERQGPVAANRHELPPGSGVSPHLGRAAAAAFNWRLHARVALGVAAGHGPLPPPCGA